MNTNINLKFYVRASVNVSLEVQTNKTIVNVKKYCHLTVLSKTKLTSADPYHPTSTAYC